MEYNKDSFLAGISVGRTLKGWSGGNGSAGTGNGSGIIYEANIAGKIFEVEPVLYGEYTKEA